MSKYILIRDKYQATESAWRFIKDDVELETWRTNGNISDGDFIIEIKSIQRAVEKRWTELKLEVRPNE